MHIWSRWAKTYCWSSSPERDIWTAFQERSRKAIAAMMTPNVEQTDQRIGLREKDISQAPPTTLGKKSHNEPQATAYTLDMTCVRRYLGPYAICSIRSRKLLQDLKDLNWKNAANNVEAATQERRPFGQYNNDKHEKTRKFANTAIQKKVSRSFPLTSKIASFCNIFLQL